MYDVHWIYILSCYWHSANAWFTTQPILPICFCWFLHFFPLVLHTQLGFAHLSILGLLHCVCTTYWFNMCNVLLCVHNIDYMGNIMKVQWIYKECTWNHIWNILYWILYIPLSSLGFKLSFVTEMTRLNSLLEINIYLLQFYEIKIKGVLNEIIIILNTILFENFNDY
jgi:hypothetical protein